MENLSAQGSGMPVLTLIMLKSSKREIVFWTYDTFDYNFENKDDFTKYLKESCCLSFD